MLRPHPTRLVLAPYALAVFFIVLATPQLASADELTVAGSVWRDLNANGVRDEGEPTVPALAIWLTNPQGGATEVLTDEAGEFAFDSAGGSPLEPGSYVLAVGGPASEWVMTHPFRVAFPLEIPVKLEGEPAEVSIGLLSTGSLARFHGTVAIDGQPVDRALVEAIVNGKVCSFPSGLVIPTPGSYSIAVASADLSPGCGRSGDEIRFRINGVDANESATWAPARSSLHLSADSTQGATDASPVTPTVPPPARISPPDTGSGGLQGVRK